LLDGYGFIQADDGSRYFFHRSEVVQRDFNMLKYNETCCFDVEEGDGRGPVAINVINYSEIEGK
jgi:cold shock CspA family protein